jgi:type IV secretion system protein VirB6
MDSTFFVTFSNEVFGKIDSVSSSYQSQYGSAVMTLVAASVTLYMLWRGYQILAGKTQTPLPDIAWDLVKFAIILTFVSNSGGYLTMAAAAINGLKGGVVGGVESPWQMLDMLWNTTQELADTLKALDSADWVPVEGGIAMLLAWAGAIITMIAGCLVFLSAEISIRLLIIVAPIFIFCLMWGFLRQMFNNWLQSIFSSLLTIWLASMVLRFSIDFQNEMLSKLLRMTTDTNLVTNGATALMMGIGVAMVIIITSKIAHTLSGVGVDGAVQGMAMMGMGGSAMAVTKTVQSSRQLASRAASVSSGNRDRAWNNAQDGAKNTTQINKVAQARESLLKRKRDSA